MLYNTEAELMYPSLDGLSGLGCGGDCNCGCKKDKKGMGSTSVIGWWCTNFGIDCPTADEIARSNENAGGSLTAANQQKATDLALAVIAADDPCHYSEINGMSEIDKLLKCGQFAGNAWLWGGLVLVGGLLLLRR